MSYYNYRYHYPEITRREVLLSIAIVAIMVLFGLIIHGNINDSLMNKYQKYNTALHIENDADMFDYGMQTNIGDAFVYGELKAVDPVTYPELGGSYSYVKKVKEVYTMHTSTYTYKGRVRTRTYWSWDAVGSEDIHSDKISFLGIEFDYGTINFPSEYHIDTIDESGTVRYVYYASDASYTGSMYALLEDDTIKDTEFYADKTIEEAIDSLESGYEPVVFWVVWIVLTGVIVGVFYYADNHWLEDKKKK